MTTINFAAVQQMMARLKVLHAEGVDSEEYSGPFSNSNPVFSRSDECAALHDELSKLLVPFFNDLAEMDMLVLATRPEGDKLADVSNLEVTGINGGIQLSKREHLVLTEITDPNEPGFNPDPEIRTFSFDMDFPSGC